MEAEESRLSRIETIWSVVRRAHDTSDRSANAALQQLLNQYGGAVRRYLLGALRREDAADDAFQEFAMRFVRGDFRGADPDRGRFRNYLKTSLYRLVVDYQRREKSNRRQVIPREFAAEDESPAWERMNDEFDASWRSELLAKAWTALAQQEADTGKPYHTVLRLRADHTELSSVELAERLSQKLNRPIRAGYARVLLHRARELFAESLLVKVEDSLADLSRDRLEDELIALDLHDYCRPALVKRRDREDGSF